MSTLMIILIIVLISILIYAYLIRKSRRLVLPLCCEECKHKAETLLRDKMAEHKVQESHLATVPPPGFEDVKPAPEYLVLDLM
jgi:hypothetical protein